MSGQGADSAGPLQGKRILLGICGSIAAYKSAWLVRALKKAGAELKIIMTPSATQFISPLTLSTLGKTEVLTGLSTDSAWNNHVELGLWADLFLVAPLTAQTLSSMASGACPNLLLAVYLSAKCPVILAPAMDLDMWKHPATLRNLSLVQSDGHRVIPVGVGALASGLEGPGRMAEPEEILAYLRDFLGEKPTLQGKKVLVTAGPTREYLDPVRFVSNGSSGKMGWALVEVLLNKGAEVILIAGPAPIFEGKSHPKLHLVRVESAAQMAAETTGHYPGCDAAIFAAAVGDFVPARPSEEKIKKIPGQDTLHLAFTKSEDIAAACGQKKQKHQVNIGFALETQQALENAKLKVNTKNLNFIVLNSLRDEGVGFGLSTNKVSLVFPDGRVQALALMSKNAVALAIIEELEKQMDV
jgi:phosphopantothenoylcysteine decarboxylase / phosphopantothenate---cysteine ligase